MLSNNDLNILKEQIMAQLGQETPFSTKNAKKTDICNNGNIKNANNVLLNLTPQKILVIAGLLGGALEVKYVLVDRDQVVNVLLDGSLKRKTKLDKMLDEIGAMPFDDVLRAVLGRV